MRKISLEIFRKSVGEPQHPCYSPSHPLREALETWFPRLDTDSLLAEMPA
jgi:hypothetical protein